MKPLSKLILLDELCRTHPGALVRYVEMYRADVPGLLAVLRQINANIENAGLYEPEIDSLYFGVLAQVKQTEILL